MAVEANNDGNNIKWLFVMVLQGVCCFWLLLSVSCGTSVWVGCFYKVVSHRIFSCIQVVLLCWYFPGDILLFRSGSILGHFLIAIFYFYLSLYLYYYPLLFSFCAHVWGFYNWHILTLLQRPALFLLIWLICYYRLIYLILFYYRSH